MNKDIKIPDKEFLFGSLLMVANKIDTMLERELKAFGITSRQWLLAITIANLFETPPTLKQVAKEMSISHQNVKQVALKLQEKNLVELIEDRRDGRVTRLQIKAGSQSFWDNTAPRGNLFIAQLFANISPEALKVTRGLIQQMFTNLAMMEDNQ